MDEESSLIPVSFANIKPINSIYNLSNIGASSNDSIDIMNRLSVASILNLSPTMPISSEWQRLILDRQVAYPILPNPWTQMFQISSELTQPLVAEENKVSIENPLDLSNKATQLFQQLAMTNLKTMTETEKSMEECTMRNTARRNYTAEDLSHAVEDIRCGKLGTRRASVVYGIPRSTLRNKIYKLEAEGNYSPNSRNRKRKIFEQTEAKNLASESPTTSPRNSRSSGSPDSVDSVEKTDNNPQSSEDMNNPGWIDSLWRNLFNNQNTKLTPEIINVSSGMKKPEKTKQKSNSPAATTDEWKRSRPKRGQYRKYDKNALDEAVKSVRRGEMSVHRAGSYFGVPHSTLEYKVKERNLMRKKKDGSASSTASSDESLTNSDTFKYDSGVQLIPLISQ